MKSILLEKCILVEWSYKCAGPLRGPLTGDGDSILRLELTG